MTAPVDKDLPIEIRAEIAERITFATHQCDVPVILDLVIYNPGEVDLENVTLNLSAEPRVIGDRVWTVDRIEAGAEYRIRDRRVSLAGGMLDQLTERMRAEVRLELRQGDTVLSELRHRIDALARNEWGGARFMPELLAAFVTPNDPAVQRLLKEASRILERSGKKGSLDGYQGRSRMRTWELVAALWAAVSARGITYAEPPASFGRQGQKVRLPSMIEEQGLATCLDTALLFAAAIEQVGLYPVVVFTEGHALAGAWLQPQTLATLTVEDPIEIRKAMAQDELVLFETTMATGNQPLPFARAIAAAKRQIAEEYEDAFIYAIDIRQARGRDIQPLPSLATPVAGSAPADEVAIHAVPPLEEAPDLPPFDVEPVVDDFPQTPAERLDRWKRSLLDLSKRNRLLNLKPSGTAIPVFCPDPALLEDKLADGSRISIVTPPLRTNAAGEPDTTLYQLRTGDDFAVRFATEALGRNEIVANVEPRSLEKGVIELYRKAKTDFEEGGANTLFLALGMLRWCAQGDTHRHYRAPLILLPVKLERRSAASKPYLRRHDDDAIFNLTLLQMLRQDFQIEIPGLEGELPGDEHGVDVSGIWETVRTRVRDVPGFEVVEEVVLSTFSFAKYLMWKDLADRTEALKANPFVRHLIDTPGDPYQTGAAFLDPSSIDRRIDPTQILAPLNADSSQIVAIHASGGDGDFVLEGPPGTGKSETIGNIIAHNLGLGRRVLFVSEKMAALEVVYRRLHACGLGDFCLELHSAKANKRAVIAQLGSAWSNRDALSAEQWQRKAGQLGSLRDRLNGLVQALHAPGPGGLSPRDAIGRSLRFGDVHRLRLDWGHDPSGQGRAPNPEALEALEDIAKRLGQHFTPLQPEDFQAFASVAHADWSFQWVARLVEVARDLSAAADDLVRRTQTFSERIGVRAARGGLAETAALAAIAARIPDCAAHDLSFSLGVSGREALDGLEAQIERTEVYRQARRDLSTSYPDDRIASAPMEAWLEGHSVALSKVWPLKVFAVRRLRNAMREALGVDAKRAPAPERDLDTLATLAVLRADVDEASQLLPPGTPWNGLKTELDTAWHIVEAGRGLREAVTQWAGFGHDLVEARAQFARLLGDGRELLDAGMPVAVAARDLASAYETFGARLAAFRAVAGDNGAAADADPDLAELAASTRAIVERERRLNAWCSWVAVSREARDAGLGPLAQALAGGSVAPGQTVAHLKTAYASWLAPILIDARPELKRFSNVEHDELIQAFRDLDKEVAHLTSDYIRAKLSAEVPSRDARVAGPGYGVLARELQKRMRHKPVRQLISEMGPALTTLTPCLMMSPLSVAQFLPAEVQAFDLVVFDEASQITVPDAIGAIARGTRCIVVGDPKQMPPTRFFERGAEDDENDEARDLESILDEALAARVPHHRLTGHYRSRHESLIAFSNHAYYGGALVTYPAADTRDTAVTFHRVDGVYAKGKARTNAIEAKAVVAEVVRRLRDPQLKRLSIGVVTLNSEQQRLVEDLLDQERRADPRLEDFFGAATGTGERERHEPVFVKNLETVQGDQRDVILLSVGYGPTEPGARTMSMNFGPLNREGGERRLNVAITRATTEVVVFASFDASMIDLSRTSAAAVTDLKTYLDFAARGPIAIGEAIRAVGTGDYDSDFELAVAEHLRRLGWTVRTQIGVSKFRIDLGVVHPDAPGRFLAGIECDGATYHSSPSARDRDRVRHIILENLGWRLFRIWSTDFFLDEPTSIAALNAKLRSLLAADREAAAEVEAAAGEGAGSDTLPDTATWDGGAETDEDAPADYDDDAVGPPSPPSPRVPPMTPPARASERIASSSGSDGAPKLDPARFHEMTYRATIKLLAANIIDAEGPIVFRLLSERIARVHGFQRTGSQIKRQVWAASKGLRPHVQTPDGHSVFWPAGTPPQAIWPYRGRVVGGVERAWSDVPYAEKLHLVQRLRKQDPEDTVRSVADEIGFARVTAQFRLEIEGLVGDLDGQA